MSTGYTRQSSANIQAGLPIQSADLNNEFNQAQSAFDITTGHDHSGSSAGTGAKISLTSSVTSILPLANGGSNANLTASNGGIFYSTATAGAILAGTATASQLLISGSSTTPAWSNLASLLTSSTGITLSGTTTVNIAFTSTTGSGAVVLAASPTLTGTLTAAAISATSLTLSTPLAVASGGTGVTASTGSTAVVLSNAPTLTGSPNADNWQVAASASAGAGTVGFINANGPGIQFWGATSANTGLLAFLTGGSSRLTINTSGVVAITGSLTVSTPLAVAQGGTGAATLTQTNLSDYTAPTAWTPTDGSGAGLALSVTDAKYVKIGKVVILSAFITYPVTGNGNAAKINGLPVASASGTNGTGGGAVSATAGTSSMIFLTIAAGGTQISGMQGSSAGAFINSDLSGKSFSFTITYISA